MTSDESGRLLGRAMKAITTTEVYVAKHGCWNLHARVSAGEQAQAVQMARDIEANTGWPTQVLEENIHPEDDRVDMRILAQFGHAPPDTEGPSTDGDLGSRIFMVGLNAFGIAAIVTVLAAVLLSSFRDPSTNSTLNMLLLFVFAATLLTAGLTLMKIYIPVEWTLWRGKGSDSQARAINALLHGVRDTAPARRAARSRDAAADPAPAPGSAEPDHVPAEPAQEATPGPTLEIEAGDASLAAAASRETNADQGEQTSFQIGEAPAADTAQVAPAEPVQSLADSAAAVMDSLLEKERALLLNFAETSLASLTATRPQLQSFERVGLNLYLAGAASALADRGAYGDSVKLDLLRSAVEHTGTNGAVAEAFVQRLEAALQRPRFRKLANAGKEAMLAALDPDSKATLPPLADLIAQWADPSVRGAEVKKVTFVLTDIVGSTALTSKVGNAGAQRVVRAHNAAVRAATKNFRGSEVKHTGDGLLLTFPDAASAARAAIEIQQEATNYAKDNPDAPLVLRVGIHAGEASYEEGEYFGPALSMLNGVCAAAGESQIFVSEEAKARCVGPAFRFQDLGRRKLKAGPQEATLFKLEWTPKAKAVKGPLEYKQIGGKTALGGL